MTSDEAQQLHEQRQWQDPEHSRAGCWCCCLDCDFDYEKVMRMSVNPDTGETYTRDQVLKAVNRAADWLRDAQQIECEETIRQQSYGDLLVNLAMSWLDRPEADPRQIIEQNWDEPAEKVLSWAGLAEYDESEEDEA